MPRKKQNDLNAALAPIFAEMEQKITDAVDAYIADRFAELQSAFASLSLEPPKTTRRPRKAAAEPRKAAPRRRKRARSADVIKAVEAALSAQKAAVGIAVLRDATGYTNAQIRRALGELIKAGSVTKKGQRRDTVYRMGGKKKAPAKKKTAKKAPAKPKAPRKKAKGKTAKKS